MNRNVLVSLLLATTLAPAQSSRAPRVVDDIVTGFARWPSIATDGDRTAIAYSAESGGVGTMCVTLSDGRGLSWSPPIRLDADEPPTGRKLPRDDSIQIAGDAIYVAWEDERYGMEHDEVYFACSRDGGATWEPEQRLDKGYPAGIGSIKDWRMVASGTDVVILFTVDPSGPAPDELRLCRSHDAGATFSASIPINTGSFGTADVDALGIAMHGRTAYVAWADERHAPGIDDVFCRTDTDGGSSFGPEVQVDTSGPGVGDSEFYIEVAAELGLAAIGWLERNPTERELRVAFTADDGASFTPDQRVGSYPTTGSVLIEFDLALHDGVAYAVWHDDRVGDRHVFSSSSSDVGATWRPDLQVSRRPAMKPRLAGGNGDVFVVWQDSPLLNAGRIYARHSDDRGASWGSEIALSDAGNSAHIPEATFNPLYRNLCATWVAPAQGAIRAFQGGLRPHTCRVTGFVPGTTQIRFEFTSFRPADGIGWALLAAAPGSLPLWSLGDPRDIGLAADELFMLSGSLPTAFSTRLVAGSGTTAWIPATLPLGAALYACGVALDPTTGFGNISEVREIHTP